MFCARKKSGFLAIFMLLLFLRIFSCVAEHQSSLSKWKLKGQSERMGQQRLQKFNPVTLSGFKYKNTNTHLSGEPYKSPFSPLVNKKDGTMQALYATVRAGRQKRTKRMNSDFYGKNYLQEKLGAFSTEQLMNHFHIEFLPPKTQSLSFSAHEWKLAATASPIGKLRSGNILNYFQFLEPKRQRNDVDRYLCHFKLCQTQQIEAGKG